MEMSEKVNRAECEECCGTGFYGDNGPGIRGNKEWQDCDCCTGGVNLEADELKGYVCFIDKLIERDQVEIARLQAQVAEFEKRTSAVMSISKTHFIHGDQESIEMVRKIIMEKQRLESENARLTMIAPPSVVAMGSLRVNMYEGEDNENKTTD